MIKRLIVRNFKSIEDADLIFGNLNVFIGTNASGKSNMLDVFRFLQGLAYGLHIKEILNGREKTASSLVWDGIRGGQNGARFRANSGEEAGKATFEIITLMCKPYARP